MSKYATTSTVLAELDRLISRGSKRLIREVCEPLSIFDWWPEILSVSRMKDMRTFIRTAKSLGFNGYVCFKVGSEGCASGMWAYREESTDGYSPKDCEFLYRSFQCKNNYWDVISADYEHLTDGMPRYDSIRAARQLKAAYLAR